jgi:hypothetical protein
LFGSGLFGSGLFGFGLFGSGLSSMLIITWYLIALDKATITLEVGRRASLLTIEQVMIAGAFCTSTSLARSC